MTQKIPTTVITGFLGAGKTSIIRHLLENANGRRIALIINELGDIGIDGEIVRGRHRRLRGRGRGHPRARQRMHLLHGDRRFRAAPRCGPDQFSGRVPRTVWRFLPRCCFRGCLAEHENGTVTSTDIATTPRHGVSSRACRRQEGETGRVAARPAWRERCLHPEGCHLAAHLAERASACCRTVCTAVS